jgi:hypothetical protein
MEYSEINHGVLNFFKKMLFGQVGQFALIALHSQFLKVILKNLKSFKL